MNIYSEIVLFIVVLATNLVVLGAILAGGLTLAFRFIENVSPLLRYRIAVVVFALAILLPAATTLKIPSNGKFAAGSANSQNDAKKSAGFIESSDYEFGRNTFIASTPSTGNITPNPLGRLISIAAVSLFGKVFFGLWMTGIAWLLFREALGIRRLRQARRLWEPAAEAEQMSLFCPKNIPLYFDEQQSPGTVGLIYPAIVLPRYFSPELTTSEKVLIVRHELAHAQRRDPLVSFVLRILRVLFWISPALWLLERLIDAEREAAADRAAIGFSPHEPEFETSALNYADTLLTVAKELKFSGQRRRVSQVIGIGSGSELEIRIGRLLSASRTTRRHIASAAAAAALSAATILIVPGAGFSEQSEILRSKLTVFTAVRKNLPLNEESLESPVTKRRNEAVSLPARASDGKTSNQARAVKTNVSEDAARSSTNPAEMLNGKTTEASESKETLPARPLQGLEDARQIGQTSYGPARKSEPETTSPLISPDSDTENVYEPARRKREGERQSEPSNSRLPATAPR